MDRLLKATELNDAIGKKVHITTLTNNEWIDGVNLVWEKAEYRWATLLSYHPETRQVEFRSRFGRLRPLHPLEVRAAFSN